MAKFIVVGGGFAGLSSAVFLADKGHTVQLIEASPKLGGRAYSFEHQGEIVDNGQHILMGCYLFTLEFFELINSLDTIEIQPNLKIDFVARGGKRFQLSTEGVSYPFNILTALKNYDALSNSEKLAVVKLFLKIAVCNPKHYTTVTTKEFLESNHQTQNSIDVLWEIIHVGTMNCRLEESSAELFIRVLKQIFFTVDEATKIILPKVGLSEMYCSQSEKFLNERDCSVSLSERLINLEYEYTEQKVKSIKTSKQTYTDFDFLVLSIPPHQVEKIFSESGIEFALPVYEYSSILNIHLWFRVNPFTEKFYGLISSKFHWVFNHNKHLTLTTSAADELINLSDEQILKEAVAELKDFFLNFEPNQIYKHLIIREKRATFKPTIENTSDRKRLGNNFGNVFFTGDWTNTNLPATIESAVKSSAMLSDNLSGFLKEK